MTTTQLERESVILAVIDLEDDDLPPFWD